MDRAAVFGDADGAGVTVAVIDSGVETRSSGGRRPARPEPPGRGRPGRVPGRRRRRRADLVGHGTACAGIIHAIAPAADLVSIRVLGADNRGRAGPFAAGLAWAIEQGIAGREPQPVVAQRGDGRRLPRARGPGLLRQHAARLRGQQRDGAVLPIAVRGGRLGGRPRRRGIPTSGSTTRRRRSSSGPTASTSTSPGAPAPDPGDRQLVRGYRTWPAARRDSAPGTRMPARSRSRPCWRPPPSRPAGHRRHRPGGRAVSRLTDCREALLPEGSLGPVLSSSVGMASPPVAGRRLGHGGGGGVGQAVALDIARR